MQKYKDDYLAYIRLMDLTRLHFPLLLLAGSALLFSGCSISPNLTSGLETDELYLSLGEEYISDEEYIGYAYSYSDYDDDYVYSNEYNNGCAPMGGSPSMLGLSGYFSPWGAMYNNNYGGYNQFNYGYNQFNYGYSPYGYNQYGYNPYGYGYGYNPYGYNPYGYNPYGYNPYCNNYYCGGGNGFYDPYYGNDSYTTSTTLIKPRTPFTSNSAYNSNYSIGRIQANKSKAPITTPVEIQSVPEREPATRMPTQNYSEPVSRPASRPESRPASRPATRPESRPESRPASRPATRPTSRPESRPSARPQPSRPASRPASRPSSSSSSNSRSNSRPSGGRR